MQSPVVGKHTEDAEDEKTHSALQQLAVELEEGMQKYL